MNISLINGQYLDPNGQQKPFEHIHISEGKIDAIDRGPLAEKVIDCSKRLVLPSFTDLSQTIGSISAPSLAQELKSAAAGGIGRICLMPMTSPTNDAPAITKLIERNARGAGGAKLLQLGAMTQGLEGNRLTEYAELSDAGCVALTNGFKPLESLAITKRCFDYAHTFNAAVFIHPIEPSLYQGYMHNGPTSTFLGLKGIPEIAETVAIAQLLMLAEASGVHLHLSQISCAESVQLIRDAKQKGLRVTADVAIANLMYTEEAVRGFNSLFHVMPPLRSESDRQALIAGVNDKTIDTITSGHAPCESAAKTAPFAEARPGMSTSEYMLHFAAVLDERKEIQLSQFVTAMNEGGSSVLGLHPASIAESEPANFSICNFNGLNEEEIYSGLSSGDNAPLQEDIISAFAEHTFVDGALVYSKN